jgi:hypothetical protein
MPLPPDFIQKLEFVHPRELAFLHKEKIWPVGGAILEIQNTIRPSDIYCYLGARFGEPNGIQNFLRSNDSDNLVHWE